MTSSLAPLLQFTQQGLFVSDIRPARAKPAMEINWPQIGFHLVHLLLAFLLALPIGWDREQSARSAGLRTFPLVAIGSCGFVLIGLRVLGPDPQAQARIIEGLMTGIGFVGGGAILKSKASVRGTATAASIWNTGAVGAAVAYDLFEIALVLSAINFVTLRWLSNLKRRIREPDDEEPDHDPPLRS
jgi:putative Mg2+ transporter-C (MgtC) family protein